MGLIAAAFAGGLRGAGEAAEKGFTQMQDTELKKELATHTIDLQAAKEQALQELRHGHALAQDVARGRIEEGHIESRGKIESGHIDQRGRVEGDNIDRRGKVESGLIGERGKVESGLIQERGKVEDRHIERRGAIQAGIHASDRASAERVANLNAQVHRESAAMSASKIERSADGTVAVIRPDGTTYQVVDPATQQPFKVTMPPDPARLAIAKSWFDQGEQQLKSFDPAERERGMAAMEKGRALLTTGFAPQAGSAAAQQGMKEIPPRAQQQLMSDFGKDAKRAISAFDATFGPGSAERVLGKETIENAGKATPDKPAEKPGVVSGAQRGPMPGSQAESIVKQRMEARATDASNQAAMRDSAKEQAAELLKKGDVRALSQFQSSTEFGLLDAATKAAIYEKVNNFNPGSIK